jgi:hypothetical protein
MNKNKTNKNGKKGYDSIIVILLSPHFKLYRKTFNGGYQNLVKIPVNI